MPQLRRYRTDVDKPHLMYAPGNRAQPGLWVCQALGNYADGADTPAQAFRNYEMLLLYARINRNAQASSLPRETCSIKFVFAKLKGLFK